MCMACGMTSTTEMVWGGLALACRRHAPWVSVHAMCSDRDLAHVWAGFVQVHGRSQQVVLKTC
jgi:hypothetical protein